MIFPIPIRDENPTQRVPFVNYGLITLNIVVFLYTWPSIMGGAWWLVPGYGLVPTRLMADPLGEAFTVLTSMFMHGGWSHLIGNMLFLHIFGDNLEDSMGHGRYLGFYLLCGIAAAALQVGMDLDSPVAMVGASGAIFGVMAGYLLLYPKAPIVTLNLTILVFFIGLFPVFPAWLIAAEYLLVTILEVLSTSATDEGGVAVFAHLGGFVGGLILTRVFLGKKAPPPRRWHGFSRLVPESTAITTTTSTGVGPGTARWRRRRRKPSDEDGGEDQNED
jgi:membrane associated rhomboid family serine protease